MALLVSSGRLDEENALRTQASDSKKHPAASRLFQEYSNRNKTDEHTEIIKLKKDRLCHRLLSYIRLLLQFQSGQCENLKLPLVKQEGFKFQRAIGKASSDLDFELKCLQIYK